MHDVLTLLWNWLYVNPVISLINGGKFHPAFDFSYHYMATAEWFFAPHWTAAMFADWSTPPRYDRGICHHIAKVCE